MEEVIRQNVSFRTKDHNIVTKEAAKKGVDFSAATRIIIREWAEMKRQSQTQQTQAQSAS